MKKSICLIAGIAMLILSTTAQARMFDPAAGKWMSRDPIGEEGDNNLYRPMGNDPVNKVDPLGLYVGQMPPPPPGYNSSWQVGRWDNGNWNVTDPYSGRIYTAHPEDEGHWRHWDRQSGPGGGDEGPWPPNPGKRRKEQQGKNKLKPNQCDEDPNGDAPDWVPPSGVKPGMYAFPVDPIIPGFPGTVRIRFPEPVFVP